jgi:hypothetical protein
VKAIPCAWDQILLALSLYTDKFNDGVGLVLSYRFGYGKRGIDMPCGSAACEKNAHGHLSFRCNRLYFLM